MIDFSPNFYVTEDFFDCEAINVFHKENEPMKGSCKIKNYHVLVRAEYIYASKSSAVIRISADDYYKLYINGKYVCQGPAPSFSDRLYYNETDITSYLDSGRNVIAVHIYYQGLINRVWQSGDASFGVGADIVCDGVTDLEFKYKKCLAYSGETVGYDTDFLENFDSRCYDENWREKEFDDLSWRPMTKSSKDRVFIKQPTETVSVYEMKPKSVIFKNGAYLIDMGTEICAVLNISAKGKSGDIVNLRYAEEMNEDGSPRYKLRANCNYEEKWTLSDGKCNFEGYCYKGFRYVEILPGEVKIESIKIMCRHYPFDDDFCKPKFKDPRANEIFKLCKNTIKYATQESFIDCPTREKGQYLGDAFIAGHSHMLLTGKTELFKKAVDDFAQTSKICPGLMAVAPCSLMQEIADYSLIFGEAVLLLYEFEKDIGVLEKYYDVVKNVLLHFKKFERADGLLQKVSDKWNLVDWPENLRDSYDFELSRPVVGDGVHSVINAYYIGAVKALNKMEDILGLKRSFDCEKLSDAYRKVFMRGDGLFVDSEKSDHSSLHANVFSLYFGLVLPENTDKVCDLICRKGLCCGVYVGYFLLKALCRCGREGDAYGILTNEGEHSWLNMIREGATTCFEAWGKEQKFNTSLCHPWATAPIAILLEDMKNYA